MLTLASKLKRDDGGKTGRASGASDSTHRVSIRDRLLTKGTGTEKFQNLKPISLVHAKPVSQMRTSCIIFSWQCHL
ncbi:hypothetical protein NQZ68_038422, partial [Dissostichus eleginoides]